MTENPESEKRRRGRPPVGDRPMTAAERQAKSRRQRAQKRSAAPREIAFLIRRLFQIAEYTRDAAEVWEDAIDPDITICADVVQQAAQLQEVAEKLREQAILAFYP